MGGQKSGSAGGHKNRKMKGCKDEKAQEWEGKQERG